MKKILLSLCAMLLAGVGNALAEGEGDDNAWTLYAVVAEDADSSGNRTLTFMATNKPDTIKFNSLAKGQELGTFEIFPDDNRFNYVSDYLSNNSKSLIKKAVIDETVKNVRLTSTSYMFLELGNLTTIVGLENLNTSEVTSMSSMFSGCSSLTSLDLNFDTKNVTSMANMFFKCYKLDSLDISSLNTGKVTNMRRMFAACTELPALDLRNFDTKSVTDMSMMFGECIKLSSLDVSSFNTGNVTNMSYMFYGCSKLPSLDISNFNTGNVTDMSYMFYGCSKLPSLDISNFNTGNVTNMSSMFSRCALKGLKWNTASFKTSKVKSMRSMFSYCNGISYLDLSFFDTKNVTDMREMFSHCPFDTLKLGTWDISNVEDMQEMFRSCSTLKELTSHFVNAEKVKNMSSMFSFCSELTTIDMDCNTKSVTTMANMFRQCHKLKNLKWDHFNTESVTTMNSMFEYCSFDSLPFPENFKTDNVKDMASMFKSCDSLTSIDVSKFNTSNVTSMRSMFQQCGSLRSLDISNFDISKVTSVSYFASYTNSLRELNLGKNDLSKVEQHNEAFYQVGYGDHYELNKQGNHYKYFPRHLIFDFDISSLGDAITDYSINKNVSNQQFTREESRYTKEIPPVRMYCGGAFTIADTLNCGNDTKYTPVAGTRETDLWQYDRHMKAGQWNTMFVPVATTVGAIKKANYIEEVCQMESYDGTTLKFKTIDDTTYVIPANTPVMVRPQYDLVDLAYTTVTTQVPNASDSLAVSTEPVNGYYAKFYGCYEYGKKLDRSCYYYKISTGQFVRSHGNSYCDNTRGYFRFFKDGSADTNGAKQFALDDGGVITTITAIDGEPVGVSADKAYNLSGQRVGRDYKGIVIVGGRKVVRK